MGENGQGNYHGDYMKDEMTLLARMAQDFRQKHQGDLLPFWRISGTFWQFIGKKNQA
jgi:hypothetical protein